MYGFGVIIGMIVAGKTALFDMVSLFGFLTAVFIEAGTFALNDYCDMESDIANDRKDRPLVRGDIKKEEALVIAVFATLIGIIFALLLSPICQACFFVALALAMLGVLYDIKVKQFLGVSNLFIAFTMAIPFVFGGLIVGRLNQVLLVISTIALLAGLGREVMKDIMDVRGDVLRDIRSIALVYGIEKAQKLAIFSYSLAIILTPIPFFMNNSTYFLNGAYMIPIMVTDALLLHTCFRWRKGGDIRKMRKATLIAIAIGLFAFICGAF